MRIPAKDSADLLICWCKLFAVPTPGRIELNKHIFAAKHNLVKGGGCDDSDWSTVVLGRLF